MKNIAIETRLSPLPMYICCSPSLRTRCPESRTTLVSSSTNFCRQIKALHTLLNSFGNSKMLPHVITSATAVCSSCTSTTMTVTHRRHEDGLPTIPLKPTTPIHVVWATCSDSSVKMVFRNCLVRGTQSPVLNETSHYGPRS